LRRKAHGGFGERPGETGREQSRHRAPGRLNHDQTRRLSGGQTRFDSSPSRNSEVRSPEVFGTDVCDKGIIATRLPEDYPQLVIVPERYGNQPD
jgi:hypothetical protein